MNLILQRKFQSATCTMGELALPGTTLHTLERPWVPSTKSISGTKGVSCVPPGIYKLIQHSTELHPKTFALENPSLEVLHWEDPHMPNARTAVLIHVANYPTELRGCIGVGLSGGACMLNQSRAGFDFFLGHVPWVSGHTLEIRSQP